MKRKRCFSCRNKLFLFMFCSASGYMRESEMGRLICCRICRLKRAWRESVIVKINGKFEVVRLTRKEAIKEFFKK